MQQRELKMCSVKTLVQCSARQHMIWIRVLEVESSTL